MKMSLFTLVVLGYLLGSVPFALVIGKGIYRVDVRHHGSGNLGATNTGRVLGLLAGGTVMILDAAKASLIVILSVRCCVDEAALPLSGLAVAIGHCYPVFAGFKGGKAVAVLYGFLFGLITFAGYSPSVFVLPLGVFMGILYCTKIVSLSGTISAVIAAVCVYLVGESPFVFGAVFALALLVLFRHRENIQRVVKGEENKISWL